MEANIKSNPFILTSALASTWSVYLPEKQSEAAPALLNMLLKAQAVFQEPVVIMTAAFGTGITFHGCWLCMPAGHQQQLGTAARACAPASNQGQGGLCCSRLFEKEDQQLDRGLSQHLTKFLFYQENQISKSWLSAWCSPRCHTYCLGNSLECFQHGSATWLLRWCLFSSSLAGAKQC